MLYYNVEKSLEVGNMHEDLNIVFGRTLADLRKNEGLTQKQLAKKLNVSERTLAHYEQGGTLPNIYILSALADYFKVPVDYLLGRCQNKIEYTKMNEKISDSMNLGQMINIISCLPHKKKKYLSDTINLLNNKLD